MSPLAYRSLGVLAVVPGCTASVWSLALWLQDVEPWIASLPLAFAGGVALLLLLSRTWSHIGVGLLVGVSVGGVLGVGATLALVSSLS